MSRECLGDFFIPESSIEQSLIWLTHSYPLRVEDPSRMSYQTGAKVAAVLLNT